MSIRDAARITALEARVLELAGKMEQLEQAVAATADDRTVRRPITGKLKTGKRQ